MIWPLPGRAEFAADWGEWLATSCRRRTRRDPFTTSPFAGGRNSPANGLTSPRSFRLPAGRLRGEQWIVDIPHGPPRGRALVLRRPEVCSTRIGLVARRFGFGQAFQFLAVAEEPGTGRSRPIPCSNCGSNRWPKRCKRKKPARIPGAADDPWFDGKPFHHTLVARRTSERSSQTARC